MIKKRRFQGDVTSLPTWLDKWTGRPKEQHCSPCSIRATEPTYTEQYVYGEVALYCKACSHEYVEQGTTWSANDDNLYGELDAINALKGERT